MSLKLGVPSKGRLMDKTFDWFAQHGVELGLAGGDREYAGFVQGIENVELILLSAGEIPRELAAGRIHLGVTGTDLVRETSQQWENLVGELAELGFGQAGLAGGMVQVVEGARQAMGRGEQRQVKDCERVFVTGTGGVMSEQSALVLEGG